MFIFVRMIDIDLIIFEWKGEKPKITAQAFIALKRPTIKISQMWSITFPTSAFFVSFSLNRRNYSMNILKFKSANLKLTQNLIFSV